MMLAWLAEAPAAVAVVVAVVASLLVLVAVAVVVGVAEAVGQPFLATVAGHRVEPQAVLAESEAEEALTKAALASVSFLTAASYFTFSALYLVLAASQSFQDVLS